MCMLMGTNNAAYCCLMASDPLLDCKLGPQMTREGYVNAWPSVGVILNNQHSGTGRLLCFASNIVNIIDRPSLQSDDLKLNRLLLFSSVNFPWESRKGIRFPGKSASPSNDIAHHKIKLTSWVTYMVVTNIMIVDNSGYGPMVEQSRVILTCVKSIDYWRIKVLHSSLLWPRAGSTMGHGLGCLRTPHHI
jgi:hypothetical protein